MEQDNIDLFKKKKKIEENEARHEEYRMDDAEFAFVAFGTAARVVRSAIDVLREEGYKVGLIRPITLWPFPVKAFERAEIKRYMDVELNMGQMVPDVQLACNDKNKVDFFGHTGGILITVEEVIAFGKKIMGGAN